MSVKWSLALGFGSNQILHGFVCNKHFEKECFKGKQLKKNATPTIIQNRSCSSTEIDDTDIEPIAIINAIDTIDSSNSDSLVLPDQNYYTNQVDQIVSSPSTSSSSSSVATVATTNPENNPLPCTECKLKDAKIQELTARCKLYYEQLEMTLGQKDIKIQEITKKLNKTNKKIWYLEKVKRGLSSKISELTEKSLITEEQRESLEVFKYIFRVKMVKMIWSKLKFSNIFYLNSY